MLATQSGRGRQVRDLRKRAVELSSRLDQRRGIFQQLKGMKLTRSRLIRELVQAKSNIVIDGVRNQRVVDGLDQDRKRFHGEKTIAAIERELTRPGVSRFAVRRANCQ